MRYVVIEVAIGAAVSAVCALAAAWLGAPPSHWSAVAVVGGAGAAAAALGLRMARGARRDRLAGALAQLDGRIAEAASARRSMRVKAETAGRFREEFVAAVRHELNTPLNAILGFSQVLLDEIDGPLTAQQREDVDAICAAGLHLSDLIEAVLAEWAPDRSDTPLPLVAVDLEAVAQEVATMLRGQLAARPIVLEVRAEPDLPRPLGDRRRLRQALLNLGANALRATDAGSIVFELAHEGELVRITIRDTGTGIAAEELPRLFKEFTQVGQEERHPGGSGLGLALTRAMVEWHGGRIEVDTKIGAGSAFSILLPVPR